MNNSKKNRHLIIQMGTFCALLFSIALVVNSISIMLNQMNQSIFLMHRSCRNIAGKMAEEMESYKALPWLLKYWEEQRDKVDPFFAKNMDSDDVYNYHRMIFEKYGDESEVSVSAAASMSAENQQMFASQCYIDFEYDMTESEKMIPNGNILCSAKTAGGNYFIYIIGQSEHDRTASGQDRPLSYFDQSPGTLADFFYRGEDEKDGASPAKYDLKPASKVQKELTRYTIVYQPVKVKGKTLAVISTELGWSKSDFPEAIRMLGRVELINFLCQIIATLALLFLQWRFAVRPLSELQKGVREYTKDKDTDKITENLSKIRSRNEIGQLTDDVSSMAVEMEEYSNQLVSVTAERERLGAELDVAASIQLGILPKSFPAFPDRDEFDIYAEIKPAKMVGGDLYDFFLIDTDHLGLVIGDVSGKGIPASLFMMMATTLIRHELEKGQELSRVASDVNSRLCKGNEEMMFVTVWIGILEISSGRLTSVNAGHDDPMVRRAGGRFALYETEGSLPMGVLEDCAYPVQEMTLHSGDTILVYTDGFPEAMNTAEEQFGEERMLSALNEEPDASPAGLAGRLRQRALEFTDGAEQFDDMTMLSVKMGETGV